MGFNLENYEQVKDRITRFYADHKDGRILTELVTAPADLLKHAAFKASVYLGDILKATGYAYEVQGQGVNKDAWVENSETSAIGRALANMDYCGTLRPSREEMSKVDNPKPSHPGAKEECTRIADELKLSGDERKTMFDAAGENYSNLLIMLKAQAMDATLDKVFEAGK